MGKLKPCPFCGGEAELQDYEISRCFGMYKVKVECSICGAVGNSGASFKSSKDAECDAIDKWNTRTSGWISVEDALPGKNSNCLFLTSDKSIVAGGIDGGEWFIENQSLSLEWEFNYGIDAITHWMPLPDAPEVQHG